MIFGNDKQEEIDRLEEELAEKEERIESLENQLEAEKDRRRKHTREKQQAQKEINRLEDKIEGLKSTDQEKEDTGGLQRKDLTLDEFKSSLEKLGQIQGDRLVTVYSPGKLRDHSRYSEIKNSIPEETLRPLLDEEGLVLFHDKDLGAFAYRLRPFYTESFSSSESFRIEEILEFISSEKTWVQASRGDSSIFKERNGVILESETVKTRVDHEHGKGGFSQGRFERKRDEQVSDHLSEVKEEISGLEDVYLLGGKDICSRLEGEYLGGFDPNKSAVENFYQIRRVEM